MTDPRTAELLARIEHDPVLERYFEDEYNNARELGADDEAALAMAARLTYTWDVEERRGLPSERPSVRRHIR